MHACIAAYSTGVPFVATAYSRKFSGLFGMLEYPAVLPMSIEVDEALEFIADAVSRRDDLGKSIAAGSGRVDELLERYESELSVFFETAARRSGKL